MRFGIEFADRYDAELDAIHITDFETDATEDLVDQANEVFAAEGVDSTVEVVTSPALDNRGVSSGIGEYVLDIVEERGYDHVVMGRRGSGTLEEMFLEGASEKVIEEAPVPVTAVH